MEDLKTLREKITNIDTEMARLFTERMTVSKAIAAYKKENGLPIRDPKREAENLAKASERVPAEFAAFYRAFLEKNMELSRLYQKEVSGEEEENHA